MRRSLGTLALVLLSCAAACQLIIGIDKDNINVNVAPPDAEECDIATNPCCRTPNDICCTMPDAPCCAPKRTAPGLAGRPDANTNESDAGGAPIYLFAFKELRLRPKGEPAQGLDLDGVETRRVGDKLVWKLCEPPPGTEQNALEDQPGGGDNAFGNALATLGVGPEDDLAADIANARIWEGDYTVLIEIYKYNGKAEDSSVQIGLIRSKGLQGRPNKPLWNGEDRWDLGEELDDISEGAFPARFAGHVVDYKLIIPVDIGRLFAFPFLGSSVNFRGGGAVLDLRPAFESDTPQPKTINGIVSGIVNPFELFSSFYRSRVGESGSTKPLCDPSFNSVATRACGAMTKIFDMPENFSTESEACPKPLSLPACTRTSLSVEFTAVEAIRGSEYTPDAGVEDDPCKDAGWDVNSRQCP